jgi:hypothetical protein
MQSFQSMAGLLAGTLLAASPPPEPAKAARTAVVAFGHCEAPSSAISARSFRALLQPKLGAALQSEADTARPLGGLSERTLEEIARAVSAARKDFYGHKVDVAVATLKELAVDVTHVAPSVERWKVERDLVTLLAQVELGSDSPAAESTLASIFRVEPGYQPDTGLYPPSFRKFADAVRARLAEAPTNRLDVSVSPSGRAVYISGAPLGPAPVSRHLQAGEYRVEADFGHRGLSRTVIVPPPPALVAPVELAASVEGALSPDGGPCVELGTEAVVSVARVAKLVGATRLFGVHTEAAAGKQWVVVDEVDGSGTLLRQARAQLQTGAPENDALGPLADWAGTGRVGATVEILKPIGPAASAAGNSAGAHGELNGRILGQPSPKGFTLQTFPVSGQLVAGPTMHFPGDKFTRADQPWGKTSLLIVTDDGRVGTASADVPVNGKATVNVSVDKACTATGRVVNSEGQPTLGARLVAQQLGSRITQTSSTGPKGRFVFRELTKGDYQLTVDVAERRVVRRFSVTDACAADLGTFMLFDTAVETKLPSDARATPTPRDH